MSKGVLMLSSRFMVSGLTFRVLIHFEFIFVYCMRKCSNFILLHVAVQFSQYHLLKRLPFLHCIFLPLLWQINHKCMGLFLGYLFSSTDFCVCLCASAIVLGWLKSSFGFFCKMLWKNPDELFGQPNILITVALQYSLKPGSVIPPALFFFSQGNSASFLFSYTLKFFWFSFCEKCHWYFDRDCIESRDQFGKNCHFDKIEVFNP